MALNSHQRGPAVIVVGGQGCGKTSLITRYTEQLFNENCLATLGIDVLFLGQQPCGMKPSLWDASGHPRFAHIVRGYLGGARAALLVYDVTNPASLDPAGVEWLAALRDEAPADVVILLVGTKNDCLPDERRVAPEEAAAFAARHGLQGCLEASAKTGEGVVEVFEELFDFLRARERPPRLAMATASGEASAEPLILGRQLPTTAAASAGGGVGVNVCKPGQWNLGACFSAIGQVLCRRTAKLLR